MRGPEAMCLVRGCWFGQGNSRRTIGLEDEVEVLVLVAVCHGEGHVDLAVQLLPPQPVHVPGHDRLPREVCSPAWTGHVRGQQSMLQHVKQNALCSQDTTKLASCVSETRTA